MAYMLLHIDGAGESPSGFLTAVTAVCMAVLGATISHMRPVLQGHCDSVLVRQFAALGEIDRLFNPRLNVEQLIDQVVRHVATAYRLHSYALVLTEPGSPARVFRAVLPGESVRASGPAAVACSKALLAVEIDGVLISEVPSRRRERDPVGLAKALTAPQDDAAAIAQHLSCASFCAIEFESRHGAVARLFLCSEDTCVDADPRFLEQLRQHLSPRIENLRLLDRLAREVVEDERRRISRDIHDSAIQPYIGLKFALEALARKVSPGDPLSSDIERLVEMANLEIAELRRYVKGLRGPGKAEHASLVPVVRRQAARFGELYGIRINVEAKGEFAITESLASEVFHIVSEGLSNIRRHTNASVAHIQLTCDTEALMVQIINPSDDSSGLTMFTPGSLAERAGALGGRCSVEVTTDRRTVVSMTIPVAQ